MADPKWDETEEILDAPSFEETEEIVAEEPEVPSQLEALGRGAVQGTTLGFGEEIGAGILSAADWARRKLGIETEEEEVARKLKEQGFKGDIGVPMEEKDILSQYRELRDVARAREKEVKEAQPGAYLAGEIAGGVAPAIATGGAGAVTQAAKVGLKEAAKAGAKAGTAYGGISGLGMGEADLTKGEVGEAALETGLGAVAGAGLGAALPVVGKVAKPLAKKAQQGIKKVGNWIDDMTGEIGTITKEAAKMTRSGKTVASRKALAETTKNIEGQAEKLNKTINEITSEKAKKLVKESLDSEAKINITDDVDRFISRIDDTLEGFSPDSNEAKVLGNVKARLNKVKSNLLKDAGQDPNLPTKAEAYKKLLAKKQNLDAIARTGTYEAKAIDNLFNKVARMKKGWKPGSLEAERVQKDFNLADKDSAIEMLKDVAKLKISRPKVDKVTGEIKDELFELREVVKRYEPKIIEREGRMMLQRGPGAIREGEVIPFRPDEITQPVELAPQELFNLQKELRDLTLGQPGVVKKVGAEIGEGLSERLKGAIGKGKEAKFEKGMELYRDIYDLEELIPGISRVSDRAEANKMIEKTQEFIEKQMPGLDPGQRTKVVEGFKKIVKRSIPELGEKFIGEAGEAAKLNELQKIAHRSGMIRTLGPVETVGARLGALAGRGMQAADIAKASVLRLKELPAEQLQKLAGEVKQVSPNLSNFLNNLATVDNSQRKAALLFSASQKPDLKKELEALFKEKEEK